MPIRGYTGRKRNLDKYVENRLISIYKKIKDNLRNKRCLYDKEFDLVWHNTLFLLTINGTSLECSIQNIPFGMLEAAIKYGLDVLYNPDNKRVKQDYKDMVELINISAKIIGAIDE